MIVDLLIWIVYVVGVSSLAVSIVVSKDRKHYKEEKYEHWATSKVPVPSADTDAYTLFKAVADARETAVRAAREITGERTGFGLGPASLRGYKIIEVDDQQRPLSLMSGVRPAWLATTPPSIWAVCLCLRSNPDDHPCGIYSMKAPFLQDQYWPGQAVAASGCVVQVAVALGGVIHPHIDGYRSEYAVIDAIITHAEPTLLEQQVAAAWGVPIIDAKITTIGGGLDD